MTRHYQEIVSKKNPSVALPENLQRRNFLKLAALGTAVFAVGLLSKKVDGVLGQQKKVSKLTKKHNQLSEDLLFSETDKEFSFFDKSGSEILVFEKES